MAIAEIMECSGVYLVMPGQPTGVVTTCHVWKVRPLQASDEQLKKCVHNANTNRLHSALYNNRLTGMSGMSLVDFEFLVNLHLYFLICL